MGIIGVAGCWVLAINRMQGMDLGVATSLGSFGFFAISWLLMMAAMMLPGLVPAISRPAREARRLRPAPLFALQYVAVWSVIGVLVYASYRPHGTMTAGLMVIVAGVYELTSIKRHFRRRCLETAGSGLVLGLSCVGSSIGLMAMFVGLGVMSTTWMAVVAIIVSAQKYLPARTLVDVPLALAMLGLGILILAAPSVVPGLIRPMVPSH